MTCFCRRVVLISILLFVYDKFTHKSSAHPSACLSSVASWWVSHSCATGLCVCVCVHVFGILWNSQMDTLWLTWLSLNTDVAPGNYSLRCLLSRVASAAEKKLRAASVSAPFENVPEPKQVRFHQRRCSYKEPQQTRGKRKILRAPHRSLSDRVTDSREVGKVCCVSGGILWNSSSCYTTSGGTCSRCPTTSLTRAWWHLSVCCHKPLY